MIERGEYSVYQGKYFVSVLGYFVGIVSIALGLGCLFGQGYGWLSFGLIFTFAIYRHRKQYYK